MLVEVVVQDTSQQATAVDVEVLVAVVLVEALVMLLVTLVQPMDQVEAVDHTAVVPIIIIPEVQVTLVW